MADIIISESKLEDMLYDHLSGKKTSENIDEFFGSETDFIVERQFNIGNYGIADIVVFKHPDYDGSMGVDVYELKKGTIDKSALTQILKYKVGIKKYADINDINLNEIHLYLIGGSISKDSHFQFIPQAIDNLEIYTYDIDADSGISFNCEDSWGFKELNTPDRLIKILTCVDYKSTDKNCSYYHYIKKSRHSIK